MKLFPVLIAVVCFVLAALYWTGTLQLGASEPGPHVKHAIVFIVIGLLSLAWSRFQGARS